MRSKSLLLIFCIMIVCIIAILSIAWAGQNWPKSLNQQRVINYGTYSVDGDTPIKVDTSGRLEVTAPQTTYHVAGTASSSGDNTLVSAPGTGYRLVITFMQFQLEGNVPVVLSVKRGSSSLYRCLCVSKRDGCVRDFPLGTAIKLPENTGFVLNLTEAVSVGYSLSYYIETVQQ